MGRNQANDQSCANSPRRGEARCGMLIKEKWQQLGKNGILVLRPSDNLRFIRRLH